VAPARAWRLTEDQGWRTSSSRRGACSSGGLAPRCPGGCSSFLGSILLVVRLALVWNPRGSFEGTGAGSSAQGQAAWQPHCTRKRCSGWRPPAAPEGWHHGARGGADRFREASYWLSGGRWSGTLGVASRVPVLEAAHRGQAALQPHCSGAQGLRASSRVRSCAPTSCTWSGWGGEVSGLNWRFDAPHEVHPATRGGAFMPHGAGEPGALQEGVHEGRPQREVAALELPGSRWR
jgi:hypothetical protein